MKVKPIIAAIVALTMCGAMAGCGNTNNEDSNPNDNSSNASFNTAESTTDDSSEQETSSATDSENSQGSDSNGDKSSDGDQNGSGDNGEEEKPEINHEEVEDDIIINGEKNHHWGGLRWVKVNGYDFDDIYITKHLDLFMECAQVQKTDKIHYNPSDDNDGVFFYGNGYGAEGIDGCVYVEVVPVIMGSLPSTDEVDLSKPEGYYLIRSLYANEDTPEELGVTFAGIKIGDSKERVEELYGAGGNTNGYTYYADKEGALLLTYDEDDKVKEMYLFIDYEDYLKIKYTME